MMNMQIGSREYINLEDVMKILERYVAPGRGNGREKLLREIAMMPRIYIEKLRASVFVHGEWMREYEGKGEEFAKYGL